MSAEVKLRPAESADREYVERLLMENDLPITDLSETLSCLYICETATEQVGVAGLEQYHDVGLVRSVAIGKSARGNGYGTSVCDELLARARTMGISTVYLLTTTAEDFFARLGFEEVARESAPTAIQQTSEFSDLCPVTAVCMKRDIDDAKGVTDD